MTLTLADFQEITVAEEYFEFFQLPYEPQVVNVNRLHILKQFSQEIKGIDEAFPTLTEAERLEHYQKALQKSYQVFLTQSPLETKLFKVFQQKPQNVVMLSELEA